MQVFTILSTLVLLVSSAFVAEAQSDLPLAETIPFADTAVAVGTVIAQDEDTEGFTYAASAVSNQAYGVVATRPPIVLVTASNTVPVVTRGTTEVLVASTPSLTRGDVLTLSETPGVATKATSTSEAVFAVVLEASTATTAPTQRVLANIDRRHAEQAFAVATEQIGAATSSEEEEGPLAAFWRPLIASLFAAGAIAFLLLSIRSILKNGITSVGRNPRAQRSVVVLAIASVLAVLLITAVILLTAIAVLVLPV